MTRTSIALSRSTPKVESAASQESQITTPGISIEEVSKTFVIGTPVLKSVSLDIQPGELICFLGPSGCGKTTLLRSIAGLDVPDSGRISIGKRPVFDGATGTFVPPNKRGLGMVFQSYALWPHMTIEQNIAYPLRRKGIKRSEASQKVRELAEFVGIDATLGRSSGQLSGGQQQRVALARALAGEPQALLLDEPLSNLDAALRMRLRRELRTLHDQMGLTTVLVTHDQDEAAVMADRIAMLHQGVISEVGPPEQVLDRPREKTSAEFVGFENFIPAIRLKNQAEGRARVRIGDETVVVGNPYDNEQTNVELGFRASSVRIAEPHMDSTIPGTVEDIVSTRNVVEMIVTTQTAEILVRQPRELLSADLSLGDSVGIYIDPERTVLY